MAQALFAPATNVVFLSWMHILGGGEAGAMIPYVLVRTRSDSSSTIFQISVMELIPFNPWRDVVP